MSNYRERQEKLEKILSPEVGDKIDLDELRDVVFHGVPSDQRSHRALVWRLLLNYLPLERSKWEEYLLKKRSNYGNFVRDLLSCHGEEEKSDHPLSLNPDSKWDQFFRDNDVLLQIDKDVRRLLPEISFFQSKSSYPNESVVKGTTERLHKRVQSSSNAQNVVKKGLGLVLTKNKTSTLIKDESKEKEKKEEEEGSECHWEVVERILFIYAKLNPGQGYVQGMNEIIGPIYYTLANDEDPKWREWAEADTFYLFTNLMAEIRDFFIRSLDESVSGIKSMMDKLMSRLKARDEAVANCLRFQEIHPQYFCFRWITLLLSQEFPLPEVLRIWDSLLSDKNRFEFLIDLCCAMICHVRNDLLTHDFSHNMKLLQNYPTDIDVRDLIQRALLFTLK